MNYRVIANVIFSHLNHSDGDGECGILLKPCDENIGIELRHRFALWGKERGDIFLINFTLNLL